MTRLLMASLFFLGASASAADWNMFRGPDRNGISTETKAPLEWGPGKNIKWQVALPTPGNSSPIVSGDRVFITCAEDARGTRRSLYCFNRADGKQLWVKTVVYEQAEPTHAQNHYEASSPAADGKHVIVWHGSAGIYCYDFDGKVVWQADLGTFRHIWGYAASPVFYENMALLNCGPGVRTFLIALDRQTGKTIWKTEEPGGADDKSPGTGTWLGSWSTPAIAKVNGQDQIIVEMPNAVKAYEPKTGKVIWSCGGTGPLSYTDPYITSTGTGVYMSGFGGPAIGFKLGGSGDVTGTNQLWRVATKNPQRIGTGVIVDGLIYTTSEPAIQCIDPMTGRDVWRKNPGGEEFWSSVVKIGDRLYVTSKKGVTYVFAPDPKGYRQLAANDMGEASNSTIAVSNGELFLRTFKSLYCVAEK